MLISALEDGEGLALLEGDDRLLPARRRAPDPPPGDFLAAHLHGAHRGHVHPELGLQGGLDLVLVRFRMHLEGVLLPRLVRGGALLGDQRSHDGLAEDGHYFSFFFFAAGFPSRLLGACLALAGFLVRFAAFATFATFAPFAAFPRFAPFASFAPFATRFALVRADLAALASSAWVTSARSGAGSPVRAPCSTTTASAQSTS